MWEYRHPSCWMISFPFGCHSLYLLSSASHWQPNNMSITNLSTSLCIRHCWNNLSHLHRSPRTIAATSNWFLHCHPWHLQSFSHPDQSVTEHWSIATDDNFQWLPILLGIKCKPCRPVTSKPFPFCSATLTPGPLSTFLISVTWSSLSSSYTPSSFLPQRLCTTVSPFPFLLS